MNTYKLILSIICIGLMLTFAAPTAAAEEEAEFSGSFLIGYRGVDVEGVEDKYKEDYNLNTGPRLFHLTLHYQPVGKVKKLFDRLDLHIRNLGGDPFESFGLHVRKYGKYNFHFDRRASDYFYSDILVGHDMHHYDFRRVNDSGMLKVWLGNKVKMFMHFNRYTKKGSSTTSLDIARDEFEFDKPIDESSSEIAFGLEMATKGFALVLEEKIWDYENDYRYFLPGFSEGEATDDAANLNYLFFNQPYDFRGFTHTLRLNANPGKRLLIRGVAQLGSRDLRLSYAEQADGTNYTGNDLGYNYSGEAEYDQKMQLFDLDISYLLTDQFAFVGAMRYHNSEEEGEMEIYDVDMPLKLDMNILALEAGLQFQASPKLTLTTGFRSEKREVEELVLETDVTEKEETTRTGFFGNFKYNFNKKLSFSGDYRYGSYKDPYTVVSPTNFHRARFLMRWKGKNCYFNGSYLYKLSKNDEGDGWESEWNQLSLRTGYHNKTVKLSVGYAMMYSQLEGDRNFVFYGSPATWNIFYEGRSSLFDAYFKVKLQEKCYIGAYGNYYINDGSWELERMVLKPFVKVLFTGGFLGEISYRYVKFEEKNYGYNDYDADIFEVSFGYKW